MRRRAALAALLAVTASSSLTLSTREAYAGSYLDRSDLLLQGSRKDASALRSKMTDKELARVIHAVADARQSAASQMDVPAIVAKAHPHLLLALSKIERAAKSAIEGNYATVLEHLESSKREETIFRSMLKEAGHPLPGASSVGGGADRHPSS